MVKQICFMVMPYGIRATGLTGAAVPAVVNFDDLWEHAIRPELIDLGYTPVRANEDLGGLIIKEMLERLALSDLVLAEVSIPNANVYYEIGVRHAARRVGCVLMAADWGRPLFDVSQMPRFAYPLADGEVGHPTRTAVRQAIRDELPKLKRGESPVFQAVPNFPNPDPTSEHVTSFRNYVGELSKFQGKIIAARHAPDKKARAKAILQTYQKDNAPWVRSAALEVLFLVRDCIGWAEALNFIKALPEDLQNDGLVREQRHLAESKSGDHHTAIEGLLALVQMNNTSERQGLLGGRYKKLYREARGDEDKAEYLNRAIKHYEAGMYLDLNDYYPTSNLARLYLARGKPKDKDRAITAARVTRAACERAKQNESTPGADKWLRPTLLAAAFQAGDVASADDLLEEIERGDLALWQLDTTLDDLRDDAAVHLEQVKRGLAVVIDALDRLID